MYIILPILFNNVLTRLLYLNDNLGNNFPPPWTVSLFRGINFFLFPFFDRINLSNIDRIFLANISSAEDMFAFVLGVIR